MRLASSRPLKEIVKLDLLNSETPTRIAEIWNSFHALHPLTVSKVQSASQHQILLKNLKAAPTFLFPVVRTQGEFFLLAKYEQTQVGFYHSVDYSTERQTAEAYMWVTMYEELMESRMLYRGEATRKEALAKAEMEKLLRALLSFYRNPELYALVTIFNQSPQQFDSKDYLRLYLDTFA